MRIIKQAEILNDATILIDGDKYDLVIGKHSFYVLGYYEFGLKITNSHNGKIEPYTDWQYGFNKEEIQSGNFNIFDTGIDWGFESKKSLVSEYMIMKHLAKNHMAPEIGDTFYIENFISDYPYGYKRCDSIGRYGYMMKDANKAIPVERDTIDILEAIRGIKKIVIPSERTIGDFKKKDNLVNGYLIDIRRTIWDMVSLDYSKTWFNKKWKELFECKQNKKTLKDDIKDFTQFPHKEREENYQTYFLDGEYQKGSRDTLYRFKQMQINDDLAGKSIVDLGCNLGSVATECWRRGARIVNAYDYEKDYIDCARVLTRYNQFGISFIDHDLTKQPLYFDRKIDIVFALSLFKHMREKLFVLLDSFEWEVCYFESNGCQEDGKHEKEIEDMFQEFGYDFEKIGYTEDRSKRVIWKITGNLNP
jgi:hypothetical protein